MSERGLGLAIVVITLALMPVHKCYAQELEKAGSVRTISGNVLTIVLDQPGTVTAGAEGVIFYPMKIGGKTVSNRVARIKVRSLVTPTFIFADLIDHTGPINPGYLVAFSRTGESKTSGASSAAPPAGSETQRPSGGGSRGGRSFSAPPRQAAAPTVPGPVAEEPCHGNVFVQTSPHDATISVNGRDMGRAPVLAEKLACGEVAVRATLDRYDAATATAHVERGNTVRLLLILDRHMGAIRVLSEVAGLTVTVEGRDLGVTAGSGQAISARLPTGKLRLTVRKKGFQPWDGHIELDRLPPLDVILDADGSADPARIRVGALRLSRDGEQRPFGESNEGCTGTRYSIGSGYHIESNEASKGCLRWLHGVTETADVWLEASVSRVSDGTDDFYGLVTGAPKRLIFAMNGKGEYWLATYDPAMGKFEVASQTGSQARLTTFSRHRIALEIVDEVVTTYIDGARAASNPAPTGLRRLAGIYIGANAKIILHRIRVIKPIQPNRSSGTSDSGITGGNVDASTLGPLLSDVGRSPYLSPSR